jgi:hypothetical protein
LVQSSGAHSLSANIGVRPAPDLSSDLPTQLPPTAIAGPPASAASLSVAQRRRTSCAGPGFVLEAFGASAEHISDDAPIPIERLLVVLPADVGTSRATLPYPRWWHAALGKYHSRKGEYREALVEFKNMNLPNWWWNQVELAYTYSQPAFR